MEDELWLKKIKDKLEDYSEPLPVAGWERLEKELSLSGTPITCLLYTSDAADEL